MRYAINDIQLLMNNDLTFKNHLIRFQLKVSQILSKTVNHFHDFFKSEFQFQN